MLSIEIQQVLEEMKNEIINGTYPQGEPLLETPLAIKYGVKRPKMHQVIDELEKLSLVDKIFSKGAFVKVITARDIQEIFELKEAVEGMAARLAAKRRRDDELNEMIILFEEAKRSFTDEDFEGKIQMGDKLHHFILKNCENTRILNTIKPLELQVMRIWKTGINVPNRINKAFTEHIDILMAIKDKNEDLAEMKMKLSISSAYKDYISHLYNR